MYYSFSWLKIVSNVITYLAIFGLLGWFLNALVPALAAGLLSLLAWNYWQLNKLNNWLWNSKKISPPTAVGIWEHVYEGIYHLSRRNRKKRKELGILVKRFRDGSEALPDAAVVVDDQANIVWCNRLARIELGLRWPDDAGRRIDNFIRNPKFIEYFYAGQYHFPIEVASPSNPHKMFEYRIMQYGEEHLLIIVRDVSRLSQLESMRRDFVANVSHELRTPLTVINGYLEMLPEQFQADPLAQKALQEMSSQTKRMHNLIEDLLVLSRIELSAEKIYEKTVNMLAVVDSIKMETDALNQDLKHIISFDIEEDFELFGVETELHSACSNLVLNAMNYTSAGGRIKVSWRKHRDGIRFAVSDNGEGIHEKHLSRLTERFYRVDPARSSKTGGSGLGLSIVKHVLNHHNSRLDITSIVGEGSEFSFTLPNELIKQKASTKA